VVNGYSALAELGFSAWEGVNTLVRKSWDGASSLFFRAQHWISKGQHLAHDWMSQGLDSTQRLFGEARRAIGNEAQRWGSAAKNFALGIKDAWVGFAKNFMEAGMRLSHSLALVSGGEFSAAGVELGKGILCIPQAYVDLGLMAGGKAISAAQTVMHLEPVGRPLTDAEITYLRQTFGESIDYSSIEVKVGNAGLLTVSGRPFVLGNTIYMPDENFTPAELAHEATHVWQHQHSGTDYLSEALVARYITGTETSGYAWWDSVPGTPFSQLNPEKQGEFIEAAVRFNAFATTPPAFSHKPAAYQGSLADLNAYLQASVKEIRNVSSIT
jgi:hypothetical protein